MAIKSLGTMVFLAVAVTPAIAADWGPSPFLPPSPYQPGLSDPDSVSIANETVRLRASIGALFIEGDEYVFNGDRTLSHLIWQSKAPVLRAGIDLNVGNGFSVSAESSVAGYGTSYMEDYDWFLPTDDFDNWTHRSQHPDTDLNHYFSGEIALGYDLSRTENANVRMHGGFSYTDVHWAAYGGRYVYSVNGFRDETGSFPDGEPAIDYRQRLPEVFIGVDGEETYGSFRLAGLLRGGVTVLGNSTDNHWMRDLRVEDSFGVAPTLTAGLDAGFALGPMAELFIGARYDHKFMMRGRAEYIDTNTETITIAEDDIAGAALRTLSLNVGLKARF
ncbi:MAG: omptin family outer membrane protease [Devosia sp.]|uniref:omptin family outer membrane protease n=1 Tax=Devosia sp. TaxID=1871048 RepID=UPI0024CA1E5B|nr:omptin family outer membrane protease [Devosia sp.]UYN98636.1 MAG: omptin family outer membrane protease [Devosia sp.]